MKTLKDWTKQISDYVKADPIEAVLYVALGASVAIVVDAVVGIIKESKSKS